MNKKILLILFLLPVCLFFVPHVKADSLQYKSQISCSKFTLGADNKIQGQFSFDNIGSFYMPDLNYSIKLFENINSSTQQLIDVYSPTDILSIAPNQTLTKNFTYQYPKNIPNGNYTLRIQFISAKGIEIGWVDQAIALTGNNNFINIQGDSPRVVVGSNTAYPLDGISVLPTDTVTAYLKVQNPGNSITVVPQIRIFKRQFNMALVKQYNDSSIIFAKGETKDINLIMPKLNTPESYLAEVKFYENGKQVSGLQYFRWVVEGSSAKVLDIISDNDSYAASSNMKLTVYYIGPADFSTVNDAKLQVTVYDQNKKIVVTKLQSVNLGAGMKTSVINIPVTEDIFNPTISAKITKGNLTLDEHSVTMPVFTKQAKQLQQKIKTEKLLFYLVLLLIILIIAIFLIFKFNLVGRFLPPKADQSRAGKNKKSKK